MELITNKLVEFTCRFRDKILTLQVKTTNMSQHLRTFREEIEKTIDPETGEVIDLAVHKHNYLAGEEEFFLVYTSLMNVWERWDLSTSDLNLFSYLCNRYSNGAEFTITSNMKAEIANISGRKPTTFNNSTRALIDKRLIIKISPRSYKLNPRYIFKGSSKNRNKALIEILSIDKNA